MGEAAVNGLMQDPANTSSSNLPGEPDNCEVVHGLMERCLAGEELVVPLLPEVAVRVVRAGPKGSTNAQQLADIISADPALTMYVLRIAASAAKRPASPIVSLPHAVAWLGFDEVANIAFTLALQGKMLDVKGQHCGRGNWRTCWRRKRACATCVDCCTISARSSRWARSMSLPNARAKNSPATITTGSLKPFIARLVRAL
jgi:hypothetical protein